MASGETADARIPPMPAAVFAPGVVRPAEIDGMPSAWFARMLEKPVRQWISPASGLTPEDAAGLKAGFDELVRAAGEWRASRGFPSARRSTEMAAASLQREELTPKEAEALLGVSDYRVRQLLRDGKPPGRLEGRRWTVKRSDVIAYRDAPNGAVA